MKTIPYSGPHGEEFPNAIWVPNSFRIVFDSGVAEMDFLVYVSQEKLDAGFPPLKSETRRIKGAGFEALLVDIKKLAEMCEGKLYDSGKNELVDAVDAAGVDA